MNALWTNLRRLVASLMLAAMASFVLHGGAMAALHGHGPGADCVSHGSATHAHVDGAHHHHGYARTAAADHGGGEGGDHDAAGGLCCGSACTVALMTFGTDLVVAPRPAAKTVRFAAQLGDGLDPGGLRRPPRSLDIA